MTKWLASASLVLPIVLMVGSMGSFAVGGQKPPPRRTAALAAAIAEIEAGKRTTPLVGEPAADGETSVTFLARRAGGRPPRIVSDVTGWGEHVDGTFDFGTGRMTRVGQTEWYALEAKVALRARIEYRIAYGLTDYRFDPHNPRRSEGARFGGLPASEFVTPGYRPPPEFAGPPAAPVGATTEATIDSRALGGPRTVAVYTPSGYREEADYPVAVMVDRRWRQVTIVLDWLIARAAIEPIVAVFVEPALPGQDYPAPAALRTFLTDELPAWMASRPGLTKDAGRRAIISISYGAKDVLDAALDSSRPAEGSAASWGRDGAFGRLGLLIPGRRIGPADIAAIAARSGHLLRVAILAGRYDLANVGTARGLRRALAGAGHAVDYSEVPEGHSAVTWTYHAGELFASLFGRAAPKGSDAR